MSSVTRRRRRAYYRPAPTGSRVRTALLVLLALGFMSVITGAGAAVTAYSYYTKDLPSPDRLEDREVFRTTRILDRKGRLLYEMFDPRAGKRTSVKLSEMSPWVVKATIDIEDASFYENPGFSPRGILRAAVNNLSGEEIQGASSITQQLIKLVLLTPKVSYERKIQEAILAYQVSQQYTKDQILEWYINEIFYGSMSNGIEAAAETYFGKHAKDLDLAESAMLAGIPQSPSLLSPLVDPQAAKRRQRMVLDAMLRQGDITEEQAEAAARQPLRYQTMTYGIEAPHFVMYVRDQLERRYGPKLLYSSGLTVTTTIDLDMQQVAERIARQQVKKLASSNIHNAALVSLRPSTGEILAMLGSVDYFDQSIAGQVNIITSQRQPGSTFKPITYSAAFLKGWGPGTVLLDDYTVFQDRNKQPYIPRNVDKLWHGPVTLRKALGNSMNIPAVKAIQFVGVKTALDQAHQMGITSLEQESLYDLSLTLGAGEVKALDLVYAYSVLANGGQMYGQAVPMERQKPGYRMVEPVAILKVEDASGKVLDEFVGPERVEVLKPQVAYMMTSILSDDSARLPLFAPNGPLKLSRPAAAKTGTTEENLDLWTIGYTPDLVTGVWVGNSDNQPIAQVLTTMSAAPIWHDFMEEVLAGTPARDFEQPAGLEKVEICPLDGLRPNRYCPTKIAEWFPKGSAPTKECNIHRPITVDKTTGEPADASTPPENREQKVIEVYPAEWASWAKAAGKLTAAPTAPQPAPPQPSQPVERRDDSSALVLASPTTGGAVRDLVEIRGTASGKGFASYKVEYGEGLSPTSWKLIGTVHSSPVESGVLERWDTRSIKGLYRLRITLTERPPAMPTPAPVSTAPAVSTTLPGQPLVTAVRPPTAIPTPARAAAPTAPATKVLEIPVMVDNTPPEVALTYPADNATFRRDQRERLTLTAQVSDNHRVAKIDFFVDDRLIGSSAATPATIEWLTTAGDHVLRAVARDQAGNEARSPDVKIAVR